MISNPNLFKRNEFKKTSPLILIAAFGIVLFLLVATTFTFKDNFFASLFAKPYSYAAEKLFSK